MVQRNHNLDGLRGIAALSVALGHSASFAGGTGIALKMTPSTMAGATWTDSFFRLLHILFHADAAVVVFFVLSGLVLTRSLRASQSASLVPFTIRRTFRLLPVAIAAALIIGFLRPTSTWPQMLGAAFLYDTSLNGVLWTLQIEVFGSALVFALWFARRLHMSVFVVFCAVVCALAWYYPRPAILFMPAFVLGALIDDLPRLPVRRFILAISLFSLMTADFFLGVTVTTRWLQMFGSFGLVAYLAQNSTCLTGNMVSNFLGRISYPFYLLHLAGALIAIKLGLMKYGLTQLPLFAAHAISSVAIALMLAWVVHLTAEKPGMKLGEAAFRSIKNFNREPLGNNIVRACRAVLSRNLGDNR